jgi:hypothetical protein
MGRRRCRTFQVVCMDMWAADAKLVREHAPPCPDPVRPLPNGQSPFLDIGQEMASNWQGFRKAITSAE